MNDTALQQYLTQVAEEDEGSEEDDDSGQEEAEDSDVPELADDSQTAALSQLDINMYIRANMASSH